MSWDFIISAGSLIVPGILYMVNRFMSLETKIEKKLSEEQTRKLISDKIEPLKEDLIEIKARLEHILEFIIKK